MILPGGVWVLGLGDTSAEIRKIKAYMRRAYRSYAGNLADTELYDQQMVDAVMEMQRRLKLPATGFISYSTKVAMGYLKPGKPRGTLYTCQGTVPSTMWDGPPADAARMVEDLYYWQPIGGPYQAFPMNNSINAEKAELRLQISKRPAGDPISTLGYSQGGIVVSEVYEEMKNPSDPLHHRLKDWKRSCTWGNPSRELGVNNGNKWAQWGWGYPDLGRKSRGIMENKRRLTNTPDWWLDFAHKKDMYTDTPNDDTGEDQTAICMIIMGNWWGGPDSIFAQIFEVIQRPMMETFAMTKAIMNAGLFFGGGIKPHITYDVGPAIGYLRA